MGSTSKGTYGGSESGQSVYAAEYLSECGRPVEEHSDQLAGANVTVDDYVPQCLKERFGGAIAPATCTITAKCGNGETTPYFTYKLTWYADDVPSDASRSGDLVRAGTFPSESRRAPAKSSRDQSERARRCDGPCGQMRLLKELRQFGKCDHAICSLCIMNAPMVEAPDGSMGCCNPQCFAADLAAICPDPQLRHKYFKMIINNANVDRLTATYRSRGRRDLQAVERALKQLSSLTSLNSSHLTGDPIKEMMVVNVMILENGPYQTIRRHRVSDELGSTCTVRRVIEYIANFTSEPVENARIFYSKGSEYRNSQLFQIDLSRYGNTKILNFANGNGVLNFAVDFTNKLRGSQNSPYM